MDSDDEDGLAGLTQHRFLAKSVMPDDDLRLFGGLLENEDVDLNFNSKFITTAEASEITKPTCAREISLVSDEDLEKRKESRIPLATRQNTVWAIRVWKEWAEERNGKAKSSKFSEKLVNCDVGKLTDAELSYWLAKFVVEVRKKASKGECYPPNTLYQLCCALLRHLRNSGRPALNIFEDPNYKHFQDSIDAEMKRLTGLGFGANVKEAAAFSEAQEDELWNLGLLGDHSPSVLLNTMVFLIGKNFALRSGKEHRELKFSQLTLEPECGVEPEKLVYVSFGEKNNLGGLKHRSLKRKRVEHYMNEDYPSRCLVHLYKKYVGKCSPGAIAKDVFYLAPRRKFEECDKVWFTSNPVGYNTLGQTVKKICRDAGIEGNFTNHSLRATTATRGLAKGIPDKFIMERTGHRDVRSLQKYQRPSVEYKREMSKAFDQISTVDEPLHLKSGNVEECLEVRKAMDEDRDDQSVSEKQCRSEGTQKCVNFNNCSFFVTKDFNT